MNSGLLEKLHLQHTDLMKLLAEIQEVLNSTHPSFLFIDRKLKKFSRLLVTHIHLENSILYPRIFEKIRSDRASAESARQILADMKQIQDEIIEFLNKYNHIREKDQAVKKFAAELKTIIFILAARIKVEEEQIFQYWPT